MPPPSAQGSPFRWLKAEPSRASNAVVHSTAYYLLAGPQRDRRRVPVLQLRHRPCAADRGAGAVRRRRVARRQRSFCARTKTWLCIWPAASRKRPAAARPCLVHVDAGTANAALAHAQSVPQSHPGAADRRLRRPSPALASWRARATPMCTSSSSRSIRQAWCGPM